MKTLRTRLTFANVTSCLALFIALGGFAVAAGLPKNSVGTKQLKKNAVTTAKIKKEAVTGAKIKLSTLGKVPNAAKADSASNAVSLGNVAASAYVQRTELDPVAPTQLTLNPGWVQVNPGSGTAPPRAFRDQLDVVHLSGLIARASGSEQSALTLPSGLRPSFDLEFTTVCDEPGLIFNPSPGIVFIYANGEVRPVDTASSCTERLSLDGITFRAES